MNQRVLGKITPKWQKACNLQFIACTGNWKEHLF